MIQTEDCNSGHEEGECAALDDGKTTSQSDLEQSDDAGDEQEGGDDVASGWVVISDAQQRTEDEGYGDCGPEHGQVVLETQDTAGVPRNQSLMFSSFIFECNIRNHYVPYDLHLHHLPGRHIVNFIHEIILALRLRRSRICLSF